MMESCVLSVQGMKCDGCVQTVHRALGLVPGVRNVRVDRPAAAAHVDFDAASASIEAMIAMIEKAGFHASLVTAS
ncbi:MAG: heavy-metal-associated domain-containing protein [Candidatus Kapaibacterium sp.]